jgi:voltage-gated sodium channel
MRDVCSSAAFECTVLAVVVLSGIVVGAQIGYQIESPFLDSLELFIFAIFTLEAFAKIMCYPLMPWKYFIGKDASWNCFDFTLVVLSTPGLGFGMLMMLRLLRLARLLKFVEHMPKLKVIVRGLLGGLRSVGYVCVLMFIIFYVSGCCVCDVLMLRV